MKDSLAPIILFVYNRPEHTLAALQSLSNNILAAESTLYIYADGAKTSATAADQNKIAEVRTIIRQQQWCGTVHINESSTNNGLANSVIQGVTEIVNQYGKIIVLEDDLFLSSGFLTYMNEGLNVFEMNKEVMSINGHCFPIAHKQETFFIKGGTSTWAWGTWSRAWSKFETDTSYLLRKIEENFLKKEFNFANTYDYYNMLKRQDNGEIDSWGIKWYASVFINNGYGLWPYVSLVNNIGNDGSGVHCSISTKYNHSSLAEKIKINPQLIIEESIKERHKIEQFYQKQRQGNRYVHFIKERINNVSKFISHFLKFK